MNYQLIANRPVSCEMIKRHEDIEMFMIEVEGMKTQYDIHESGKPHKTFACYETALCHFRQMVLSRLNRQVEIGYAKN
ncbi:hypothetical protein V6R21_20380 [Limibacter armeniacum]|uniref:hypothetical protein n=1 Tax=Limibacter armeniacum TaxID=466084 RepID=UPI002FE5979C